MVARDMPHFYADVVGVDKDIGVTVRRRLNLTIPGMLKVTASTKTAPSGFDQFLPAWMAGAIELTICMML